MKKTTINAVGTRLDLSGLGVEHLEHRHMASVALAALLASQAGPTASSSLTSPNSQRPGQRIELSQNLDYVKLTFSNETDYAGPLMLPAASPAMVTIPAATSPATGIFAQDLSLNSDASDSSWAPLGYRTLLLDSTQPATDANSDSTAVAPVSTPSQPAANSSNTTSNSGNSSSSGASQGSTSNTPSSDPTSPVSTPISLTTNDPVTPSDPSSSTTPSTPTTPSSSTTPPVSTPSTPTTPAPLTTPTTPSTPSAPTTPTTPTTPSTPALPGTTKTVQLTIGAANGNSAQPLGIEIDAQNYWQDTNESANLVTQGGGFKPADSNIPVHTVSANAQLNQLTVSDAAVYQGLGEGQLVGGQLVGSTGVEAGKSWTITGVRDELNAAGATTGNMIIQINGAFDAAPAANDLFYVKITNDQNIPLAQKILPTGNATATRDMTIAHTGQASMAINLGAGTGNQIMVQDDWTGNDVLQPEHTYQGSFWALTNQAETMKVYYGQSTSFIKQNVTLVPDGQWHQYTFTLTDNNAAIQQSSVDLQLTFTGSNQKINVDDLQVIDTTDQLSPNSLVSKSMVNLIKQYGFGQARFLNMDLRYANVDQLIGPASGRAQIITNTGSVSDPVIGLPEMLQLCQAAGIDPWITISPLWSQQEVQDLMQYLGGDVSTKYGAMRAADGHAASWFSSFNKIYLEGGNEEWNGEYAPFAFNADPQTYYTRVESMFHDFKSTPEYAANAAHLSLIVNGFQWGNAFTENAVLSVPDADAVDVAAYIPAPAGITNTQQLYDGFLASSLVDDPQNYPTSIFGKPVYVYEENTTPIRSGPITAAQESAWATSLGGGLGVARQTIDLTRDYGIGTQELFKLIQDGWQNFNGYTTGHWGIFPSMIAAQTNPRPLALAAQLVNQADGQVLSSSLTDGWTIDQTAAMIGSTIPTFATSGHNVDPGMAADEQAADAMVTRDGNNLVITLFNNTYADDQNTDFHIPIPSSILNGQSVDWSNAMLQMLTGPSITSNNETTQTVTISNGTFTHDATDADVVLPGHSMASFVVPIG